MCAMLYEIFESIRDINSFWFMHVEWHLSMIKAFRWPWWAWVGSLMVAAQSTLFANGIVCLNHSWLPIRCRMNVWNLFLMCCIHSNFSLIYKLLCASFMRRSPCYLYLAIVHVGATIIRGPGMKMESLHWFDIEHVRVCALIRVWVIGS